jgi:hypothetical protein
MTNLYHRNDPSCENSRNTADGDKLINGRLSSNSFSSHVDLSDFGRVQASQSLHSSSRQQEIVAQVHRHHHLIQSCFNEWKVTANATHDTQISRL